VECPSRVAGEPCENLRVLSAVVAVEHDMDQLAFRERSLEGTEKADELTVAVTLHAAANHRAFQDVGGGKQRRDAVAGLVVRLSGKLPGSERPVGTGSFQSTDLILLVDGQHDGVGGRAHRDPRHPRRSRRRPSHVSA